VQLTVGERVVANVVAGRVSEVEEQRRDLSVLVGKVVVLGKAKALERNGHGHENDQHGTRRKHEHPPATEAGDDKSDDDTVDQAPAVVGNVDPRLGEGGRIAHHLEEEVGVVGQERVTAHLREQTHHAGNQDTAAHTGGADHVHPGLLGVLDFELDGRADLGHLGLHKERGRITLSVVLDQDSQGLLVAVFADEITRAFGKHAFLKLVEAIALLCSRDLQNGAHLEKRRADLQKRWDTPAPVSNNVNSLDGNSRSKDRSDKVGRVEQRSEVGTFFGVTQFTDQCGSRDDGKDDSHTEKHTSNDVHANCV
jgi:hypothetical protein